MNILQLCDNINETTNFSEILNHLHYNVVNKYRLDNISLVSYDAYIITIDFLSNNYEKNKLFFDEVKKQNKPLIFVYHENNKPENDGMKFLADKYKINFQLSDCSVLDTPNWNYSPATYSNHDEAYSMTSSYCKGVCNIKNTKQFYIQKKNNTIIMHDPHIEFYGQGQLDTSRMPNMIKYILQIDKEESNEIVDWLNSVNILDDAVLNLSLEQNNEKLDKLLNEQNLLRERKQQNDFYKSLFLLLSHKWLHHY